MSQKYGVNMPSTLMRSSDEAQRTFAKTLRSAVDTYGPGRRAMQTAYASLKHSFEKVSDHWVAKPHKGPSDPQAARGAGEGGRPKATYGGVDGIGHSRAELYQRARQLGISGRSRMNKAELAQAIARQQ